MFPSVLKKVRAGTVLLDLFWTPSHTQRVNSLQIQLSEQGHKGQIYLLCG